MSFTLAVWSQRLRAKCWRKNVLHFIEPQAAQKPFDGLFEQDDIWLSGIKADARGGITWQLLP